MVLGFEHDYKDGSEATTDWNAVPVQSRNFAPASKDIHEEVNILKFNLDHEVGGVAVEERFRGEFYNLNTHYTNLDARASAAENAHEGDSYFQAANTIRLEKKFADWLFCSAGYLYSKLDSDASFTDSVNNNIALMDIVPRITLEKQSHLFNLNGLIGPFDGLTLSTGVQSEWTRQHGFGGGAFLNPVLTNGIAPPLAIGAVVPGTLSSDYDQSTVTENAALRYGKIPYTTLFVEARLQQQSIGQYDEDLQPASGFTQNTAFSSQLSDLRAGFNTAPWRNIFLSAHYRRYEDDSHYHNDPVLPLPGGYPGFILARDLLTDEVETKLTWHPYPWLKTALTYQYVTTKSWADTDPSSVGLSPGGGLVAGEYHSQVYSVNATVTPCPRLFLSTTFSCQPATLVTADNNDPSVAVYHGDTTTVLANGTYVLSKNSDVFASYSFSEADFARNNSAAGLPLGIQYQQNAVQVGVMRHFGKNITAQLKYGFYSYNEPTSGGANNFAAHSVFGTFTFKLP